MRDKPDLGLSADMENCLGWTTRVCVSPVSYAASVQGRSLLLTDCSAPKEYCLIYRLPDMTAALSFAVELYGSESITFSEWLALYRLSSLYGADFRTFAPRYMSKNREDCHAVFDGAAEWPRELTEYFNAKGQLWKSAVLITKMPHLAAYITGYAKHAPTVQNFRQFVETVRDYSDDLQGDYDEGLHREITEKRSRPHIQADGLLADLKKELAPADLKADFETGEFQWSFTITNAEDFLSIIEKFKNAAPAVKKLCELVNLFHT